jgi:Glyoxalase/Bleomycin resistance protein/Dioxygenase superfamily
MKTPLAVAHVAVFLEQLETSTLGPALSSWGPLVETTQKVQTGTGPDEIGIRGYCVRTAASGPFLVGVEQARPEDPIQPQPGNSWHHVAFYSPDLLSDIADLEKQGYAIDISGRGSDGEPSFFAYMVSPHGPRVELVDAATADPSMEIAIGGPSDDPDAPVKTVTFADFADTREVPLVPLSVTTVVDDLDDLMARWQQGLGIEWGKIDQSTSTVMTPDGEKQVTVRSVTRLDQPLIAITESVPGTALTPAANNGWHHVAFSSHDLPRDVAALEARGFTTEMSGRDSDGQLSDFALLVAPEGTRVKLVGDDAVAA